MTVPDGGKAGAYCVYASEPEPLTFDYIHDIGRKRLVKRPSSSEDVLSLNLCAGTRLLETRSNRLVTVIQALPRADHAGSAQT